MDDERKAITFLIRTEIISCVNCSLCYGSDMKPTFCQEFSHEVDPEDGERNNERALNCKYWHPRSSIVDRYNFHTDAPEHERWYEKDSW